MEFNYATDTFESIKSKQVKQGQTEYKDIYLIENQLVSYGNDGTVWVSSDGVHWKNMKAIKEK